LAFGIGGYMVALGCKCGKNIGRSEARTDSTAQSEQTTIIEVFASRQDNGQQTTDDGLFARIANKKDGTKRNADNGGLKPTTRNKKQPTDTDGIVSELIENGGGVVKITRTKKATSTAERQQQQFNREIQRRNDWVFALGVVVAVAVGTRLLRK
jgi:hypothetical protein